MKWLPRVLAFFMVLSCDTPVSPPIPPMEPPPEPPPIVITATEPILDAVVGTSAFSLADRDESYIRSFLWRIREKGYNTIRVGSETADWPGGYLPRGPDIFTTEAAENLRRVLRVAGEEGFWVELCVVFTIKDTRSYNQMRDWTVRVRDLINELGYVHVFIDVVNEWEASGRSGGEKITRTHLYELISICKSTGLLVGADESANEGDYNYDRIPKNKVDFISFHPHRNPDPTKHQVNQMVNSNGLVLLTETTAYATDWEVQAWGLHRFTIANFGRGTEERRKDQIRTYLRNVRQNPLARWYFHSVETIRCETLDFWIPDWYMP